MSSDLVWEPETPPTNRRLPDALKFVLRKRYGELVDARLDECDIPYLQGLLDAGIEDAKKLLDVIEKHGAIHVKETWL